QQGSDELLLCHRLPGEEEVRERVSLCTLRRFELPIFADDRMMACVPSVGDVLNLGIVKRREPLVEGWEDCDYPIQLNMTKDNSRRKSSPHAKGPDISNEDLRRISVERVQPECRSDQGRHDEDGVLWRAADQQNHEDSGRDDCDLSALEPV